jgi:hypothetical protein
MLIGASTAAILVPKRVFSLPPPRDFTTADMTVNNYFTSPHAWYLKTEHPDGLALYSREHPLSNKEDVFVITVMTLGNVGKTWIIVPALVGNYLIDRNPESLHEATS